MRRVLSLAKQNEIIDPIVQYSSPSPLMPPIRHSLGVGV
jgi:hypothetical protein